MTYALLVFLGAGIGGVLRYGVNLLGTRLGPEIPWATFSVNVLGSFAMGFVMGALLKRGGNEPLRLFLATGVLGGFTTFSAFSFDLSQLIDRGAIWIAIVYATSSVVLSLSALYIGLAMAR